MVECEIYPSMLRAKDNKLFILLHVDDLLVTGHADKAQKQLLPALQSAYKISYSIMKEMGDELRFLKRRHILVNDRLMLKSPQLISSSVERSRLDKVQKCSRYFVVFGSRFTTLSALHSFLGNQDDVSYPALLASSETFSSVLNW